MRYVLAVSGLAVSGLAVSGWTVTGPEVEVEVEVGIRSESFLDDDQTLLMGCRGLVFD